MAEIKPAPPSAPPSGPPAPRSHILGNQQATTEENRDLTPKDKVDGVRSWLAKEGLAAYIIGSEDAHQVDP